MAQPQRIDPLLQSYDRDEHEREMAKAGMAREHADAIAEGVEKVSDDTHNYYQAMLKIWEGHDKHLKSIDSRIDRVEGRLSGIEGRLDGIEGQIGQLRAMGGIFLEDADAHEFRIGSLSLGPQGGNIALCTGCGWQRVGHGGTAGMEPLHKDHVEQVRAVLKKS